MTTVYTIGHSTRPLEELVGLLHANGVTRLADIRTVPRSRRNPQFEQAALRDSLPAAGIDYLHLPALGGLRRPSPDSPNTGWRNDSFRGYADYMLSGEFAAALTELIALGRERPTAVMCAEAVPWRCHRSLVGDALVVRGIEVLDIIGPGAPRTHTLRDFAVVVGEQVTYPPANGDGNGNGNGHGNGGGGG